MAEPVGLGMSLDDLISKQRDQQEQGQYGKQQRRPGRGRGGRDGAGGRGGRGGGGGGGGGRHGYQQQHQHPQQQRRHQQQHQQQQHYELRGRSGDAWQQRHQQQQQFDATQYRQHQSCWQDEETGDVIVRYMRTDIVRVDAAGNITLQSGGHHNGWTLASLNDALNLIGIRVTCPSGNVQSGEWSISDGRTLTRFSEGVVLPAKGTQHATRARQLLQAFNQPNRDQRAAAAAASNAAATAAGILPFTGFVPPGVPAAKPAATNGGGSKGSVFARLGGKPRYTPY